MPARKPLGQELVRWFAADASDGVVRGPAGALLIVQRFELVSKAVSALADSPAYEYRISGAIDGSCDPQVFPRAYPAWGIKSGFGKNLSLGVGSLQNFDG